MQISEPSETKSPVYGEGDTSFQAAGGEAGIRQLVEDFYKIMGTRADARKIRDMHTDEEDVSVDKLARFLCGWLGGPKLYREKYGKIHIPVAHRHLDIGEVERDAWIDCMRDAVALQPYADDFKIYLITQLKVPAERSRTR